MNVEPWRERLEAGDAGAAWDVFMERYRPLILATIRRMIRDRDDVFDVFAHVCHGLFADDLARLRRFRIDSGHKAELSTWLVTVVHNLVIDWLRHRNGRPRVKPPATLSPLQARIFELVFVRRISHLEAFELVSRGDAESGDDPARGELTFAAFLRELAETYRVVERSHPRGAMRYLAAPPAPIEQDHVGLDHELDIARLRPRLAGALESLCPEERVALQLYVVEELAAADIARMMGWPNPKAVYNRVYRGLDRLRAELARDGLGPGDL